MEETKKGKTGITGCAGLLDVGFASAIMFFIVFAQVIGLFKSIFENHGLTAFSLVKVANDISGLIVASIVYVMWFSLCFYSEKMNRWLNKKCFLWPNGILKGGFLPIPAAASVAFLLFVTGTFVSEGYVQGDYLLQAPFGQSAFSIWVAGKRCRANAVEDADMASVWGSRLDRRAPSPPKIAKVIQGLFDGNLFKDVKKLKSKAASLGAQQGGCFTGGKDIVIPVDFENSAILKDGKDDPNILNLLHPLNSTFQPDLTKLCFYQCIGWNTLELRAFLTNFGAIGGGAVIVVTVADWFSNRYGYHMVGPDTNPKMLTALFGKTNIEKSLVMKFFHCFRRSYSLTAIVISSVYILLKVYVSRLDADGYYTVDYYVTFTLVYSIAMVMIMRSWHLFEMAPQIFTRKLWVEGVDEFVVRSDAMGDKKEGLLDQIKKDQVVTTVGSDQAMVNERGEPYKLLVVKINLYQWMHISRREQYELLLNYARKPAASAARTDLGEVTRLRTLGSVCVDVEEVFNYPEAVSERLVFTRTFDIPDGTAMILRKWMDGNVASVELDPDDPHATAFGQKLNLPVGKWLPIKANCLMETFTKIGGWGDVAEACTGKTKPRRLGKKEDPKPPPKDDKDSKAVTLVEKEGDPPKKEAAGP